VQRNGKTHCSEVHEGETVATYIASRLTGARDHGDAPMRDIIRAAPDMQSGHIEVEPTPGESDDDGDGAPARPREQPARTHTSYYRGRMCHANHRCSDSTLTTTRLIPEWSQPLTAQFTGRRAPCAASPYDMLHRREWQTSYDMHFHLSEEAALKDEAGG